MHFITALGSHSSGGLHLDTTIGRRKEREGSKWAALAPIAWSRDARWMMTDDDGVQGCEAIRVGGDAGA